MDNANPIGDAARTAILETYGSVRKAAIALGIPYVTLDRNLKDGDTFRAGHLRRLAAATGRTLNDFGGHGK